MKLNIALILLMSVVLVTACSHNINNPDVTQEEIDNPDDTQEEPVTMNVELSFYNGETLIQTLSVEAGNPISIPLPEKEGYSFEGWFVDGKLISVQQTYTPYYSTEFYAKWCRNDMKEKLTVINGAVTCTDKAVRNVEIPEFLNGERITKIWNDAFRSCTFLETVILPDSINEIGIDAFYNCSSLKTINLPDSLYEIGWDAFAFCRSLAEITLPKRLQIIGVFAFEKCSSLISIEIPDSVSVMDHSVFEGCTSLSEVKIGNGLEVIPSNAFMSTAISSITIPSNIKEIGGGAFAYCSNLTQVNLSEGLKVIGYEAFKDTTALKHIELPDSVTTINQGAFSGSGIETIKLSNSLTYIGETVFENSNLTSIFIPSSVSGIEPKAFKNLSTLIEIIVDEDNQYYSSIDGVLYDKSGENLIFYPEGKKV